MRGVRIRSFLILDALLFTFFCSSGTGKTSTLVKYAEKFADLNFLYVTFNKAVAERGKSVFPRNVTCKTFHSLAFGSVGKQWVGILGSFVEGQWSREKTWQERKVWFWSKPPGFEEAKIIGEIISFTCFKPDCDLWFPNSFRSDGPVILASVWARGSRLIALLWHGLCWHKPRCCFGDCSSCLCL